MEKEAVVQEGQPGEKPVVATHSSGNSFRTLTNNKAFRIAALVLLLAIIPLTVLIARQSQDNRQHASDCGISCPVNGVPLKYTPTDGSILTTTTPSLTWSNLGTGITYQVFLRKSNPDTGDNLVKVATSSSYLSIPASAGLVRGETYYWNVQSCKKGICSVFGPWFGFKLVDMAPAVIKAYLPTDGTAVTTTTPTLTWYTPAGATASTVYTVALVDLTVEKNGGLRPIMYTPSALTAYGSIVVPISEGLVPAHRYAWNVTACNGTACSYANNSWTFSIIPNPIVRQPLTPKK